jgi:cell division septation protein DedD
MSGVSAAPAPGAGIQTQSVTGSPLRDSGSAGFGATTSSKPQLASSATASTAASIPVTKPAAKAAAAASGGFLVQVKASQNEEASNKELAGLTEKYNSVLGAATFSVRTVDLGDKGVWFRTVAGPVATQESATELCNKLKSAGLGSCMVRKAD